MTENTEAGNARAGGAGTDEPAHRADPEFEAFFRDAGPRVRSLAWRMVENRADAEDITVETFARAYLRWPRLRHESWREGWVLRVAANLALDHLRRRRRRRSTAQIVTSHQAGPEEAVVNRSLIAEAMAKLSQRQRQVVLLSHYGDLSEQEIAEALQISPGSVKAHRFRAMASMRDSLRDSFE